MLKDMPKLESPFFRVQKGKKYVVVNQINEGYEWVFEDPEVICSEKLDGTNVSILMYGYELKGIANRKNTVPFSVLERNKFIDGIRNTNSKGRLPIDNGQHFGELMGPKIQKNFLNLSEPEWFPFYYLQKKCAYSSFHKNEKTFENLSSWFKDGLYSIMYKKLHGIDTPPEGVVFYQPSTGKMAKLRRDMFDWYKGEGHRS